MKIRSCFFIDTSVRDVKSSNARNIIKIKYFAQQAVITQRRARDIIALGFKD